MTYMSKQKAIKLFEACLDELYQASKPSITWADVKERYGNTEVRFFDLHMIDEAVYEDIVGRYRKMLSPLYRRSLSWCLLGYAPRFKKKGVKE